MITDMGRRILLAMLLMLLCFSSLSCYTVLKRPGGVLQEEDRYLGEGYYAEESEIPAYYWYSPFDRWYYPSYYSRWRYYYGYPWWWDDYWYWHPDEIGGGAPRDTDRHIWDRKRGPDWSAPPSSPGSPSGSSQPIQKKGKQESSPTESKKEQNRRKPDWQQSRDRSGEDLKPRDREEQDSTEKKDE